MDVGEGDELADIAIGSTRTVEIEKFVLEAAREVLLAITMWPRRSS